MIGKDVNFSISPEVHGLDGKLSESEIIKIRSLYLVRAYRALAHHSRGSVLLKNAKIITKEMTNFVILGKKP